ncbi:peptidoglycan-recognition protein LB-like [Achroia grisella]|uniref:peptidoglycan-recognition protein LB-like n=1 Tax=Achroia grisella TaxID=688607 RepID=UPI0027D313D5|nr:peptidoglycan-recognition protein LB-like [Achroia grisella]
MILIFAMTVFGVIESAVTLPASVPSNESSENEVNTYDFPFVPRSQWRARTPKQLTSLVTPVPYVVIHHSYTPGACYTDDECCKAMKSMQDYHMDDRRWWDVGYHFGVGSNGVAYEGRGWRTLGAHALHFNSVSIGICVIGDWRNSTPPAEQLKTVKSLIAAGVEQGYIKTDYKLLGHRQVRQTECPGDALYSEITHWDHYSPFPHSSADLLSVNELSDSVKDDIRNSTKS